LELFCLPAQGFGTLGVYVGNVVKLHLLIVLINSGNSSFWNNLFILLGSPDFSNSLFLDLKAHFCLEALFLPRVALLVFLVSIHGHPSDSLGPNSTVSLLTPKLPQGCTWILLNALTSFYFDALLYVVLLQEIMS
jgi:hypothetical protein